MEKTVFFYGTLCHAPLRDLVIGAGPDPVPAWLPDHAVHWAEGRSVPMLSPAPGARVEGILLAGLKGAALDRLAFYEAAHRCKAQPVTVMTADGPVAADLYAIDDPALTPGAPWDLAAWQARWGALSGLAAEEIMAAMGQHAAETIAGRMMSIQSRAASRLTAGTPAPTTLRRAAQPGDVEVLARRQPYAHFFAVEEYDLRHIRFDGTMSEVLERATFVSTDAVTVLPYDPVRDRVLLLEQFRMGPLARGDRECWSLEPIAGRIDPGETAETTARREALEEAGLEIGALHHIASCYSSPGAQSEYIHSYLALADLPDEAEGTGGMPCEGEDIRAHVVSFDRVMELQQSGELENAPTVLSVLWLALNRARLRG